MATTEPTERITGSTWDTVYPPGYTDNMFWNVGLNGYSWFYTLWTNEYTDMELEF